MALQEMCREKKQNSEQRGKNMKKTIGFLIVTLLLPVIVCAQQSPQAQPGEMQREYTLADLYKIALERAEKIKISEENLSIAEAGRQKAASVFLPVLSAYGNYTQFSETKISSVGSITQPNNTAAWGLRLDQSLSLSGREFTAFRIAKENIMKSRFDIDAIKEDYLLSVASGFYDVLRSKKALEIAEANSERLKKHRDAAKIRLRVGEITKTAVLRAEAELASAQSELVKAENVLKFSKIVLARTVDMPEEFSLKDEAGEAEYMEGPEGKAMVTGFIEKALQERAEIKAAELQKSIAANEVAHARGLYWPKLSVEGVYSRREDHPSSEFVNKESVYGGIKLNFPFFEGGLRAAEVREAKAKQRQAELIYDDLKKSVNTDVQNAYLDLKTQRGIIKSLEEQILFAQDNFNAVSKQFEYGLANSVDVMDANTLLLRAERELFNARYDYRFSVLRLKRAEGTLLKSIVKTNPGDEQ